MVIGVSTLALSLGQIERIKEQQGLLNILGEQVVTGKKTDVFSGLGRNALTSQRARADLRSLDTFISNIQNADRRVNLMVNAVDQFKAQAENFADYLVGFTQESAHQKGDVVYYDDPGTTTIENIAVGYTSGEPDIDLESIQDFAGNVFSLFQDLLNAKDGERYLFTGAQTDTAPINDTGTLESAFTSLIANWKDGTISTQDFIADIEDRSAFDGNSDAITDTIIGYNSTLSANNAQDVFVRLEDDTEANYTILANEDPFRDILVAVSFLKDETLPPVGNEVDPDSYTVITQGAPGDTLEEMQDNFFQVFETVAKMVNQAIDDLDQIRYRLENTRATITETRYSHEAQQALLQTTISNIEDVDINESAVKLQTLSTQIEVSYRVSSVIQNLSLVNIL